MRNLRCYDVNEPCPCDDGNGKVINNYRPTLPLGNRELREIGGHQQLIDYFNNLTIQHVEQKNQICSSAN